jgi:hypothetical protein
MDDLAVEEGPVDDHFELQSAQAFKNKEEFEV